MNTSLRISTAFFLLVSLSAGMALADGATAPTVSIDTGSLRGATLESGVDAFLGIPYAAPPVGELRWKPPQPAAHWTGTRSADRFATQCMQRRLFGDMVFRASGMGEDCLYLNVWTPAHRSAKKLPVLVYFYGGGFVAGDGSEPRYDGANMAAKGMVAVTLNYRLGLFGFLAHPALSAESPQHASGDYGLLDQNAALRWVQRNIAAFGGDPRRVTIAGESAGSFSVSAQMASPLSRDLIAGAIGESGSVLSPGLVVPLATAEQKGAKLAAAGGATTLAELRALSAEKVLELSASPEAGALRPTVDGWFFPKSPSAIFAAGEQAKVPLLAGANSGEGDWPFLFEKQEPTVENYRHVLSTLYGASADAVFAQYPAQDVAGVKAAARELAGDRFITYGTWKWVDEAARLRPKVTYYYRYERPRPATTDGKSPAAEAASHSAEIEYALGNLDGNKVFAWTDADRKASHTLQGYFVNFIRTGNPNGAGLPYWPAYGTGKRMIVDAESHAAADDSRARHQVMEKLASPPAE